MGWSGGDEIVGPVILEMDAAIAEDELNETAAAIILAVLVDKCRDCDWDTYDETLEQWAHVPWVVDGFKRAGVERAVPDEEE